MRHGEKCKREKEKEKVKIIGISKREKRMHRKKRM